MIKDKTIASEINQLMLEYSKKIDATIAQVQSNCSNDEFEKYRKASGIVLGNVLLEIMNPIYKEHPDLKPKELD
jgi:hypothetical protein